MAAPEYVPRPQDEHARVYESPPWRGDEWVPDRPADLLGRQPIGPRLGYPGPDQGFVYRLAHVFEGRLTLSSHEHEVDAIAGCCAVALKRASLFGRAPVIHDLTVAFTIWGYLGEAPQDLVRLRVPLFDECAHIHHYMQQRKIADLIPIAVLRRHHSDIAAAAKADWRSMFNLRRPDAAPARAT